jgi:nucleoside-triphosphatase
MEQAILLTGRPGVGKTTLIERVLQGLPHRAGGFTTREVRGPDGQRTGFEVVTLDGQVGRLAQVGLRSHHRVGRYGVDLDALDNLAVPAMVQAQAAGWIVVVDEIGPMELFSGRFRQAIQAIIDDGQTRILGTIMQRPNPFADVVKSHPRVRLVEVTRTNRDALVAEIRGWLS